MPMRAAISADCLRKMSLSAKTIEALSSGKLVFAFGRFGTPVLSLLSIKLAS
jgi:hypothetical protein